MDFVDGIMTRRSIRIVGSLALLLIYDREYLHRESVVAVGCCTVLLLYFLLFFMKETWWSRSKYVLISSLILAVAVILHFVYGISSSSLIWPLVYVLATVSVTYARFAIILASVTIAVILVLSYTHAFPFELLLALVGFFVGIRARRIRQDAYRMSRLHLQELQQAHAELQEAVVHSMNYAALEERTRLAREIHDGLGHQLTSLIVQLQALEIMLPTDPRKAAQTVTQLLQIARQVMAEVRMAVREWSDDELGLGLVALKGLVSQTQARSAIRFDFVQESELSEWPMETCIVLYRVLQESLTNILRHAKATSVVVRIKEAGEQIVLTVADDGHYTAETPLLPGFGLHGMMERCRLHGGTCTLTPEQPHGLRLEATLPIVPSTNGGDQP